MNFNPAIFKAYDIRGVYGKDFDETTAYKIGRAYARMRRSELIDQDNIKIVAGRDMRLSSSVLHQHLIRGLRDGGCNVVDIGLASTPTFYFAVAKYNYDGGILVSASHNPKEYNGFKIVRSKAYPVSGDTGLYSLKDAVLQDDFLDADFVGSLEIKKGVLADQINYDIGFVNLHKIKPLKIVIDVANAMGSSYFEELSKFLHCEIIKMNWKLDGTFPAHEADPFKEENIKELEERVIAENADLGIATDGDGDRIFFVDNQGKAVVPGITRAILCKIILDEFPGAKICYDIRPGKITQDIIRENGGIPIVTRVGHSLIKEQAIKENAVFAGESSGHFFLNMEIGCFEVPVIVTLKLLQELSLSGKSFSDYIGPYRRYHNSGEINSVVSDPDAIISEIKKKYADGEQSDLDGISVEFSDFWFNLRKSNTEPLIRFTIEARSQDLMLKKRDEILKLIRK
jgi:phosphomannomutase